MAAVPVELLAAQRGLPRDTPWTTALSEALAFSPPDSHAPPPPPLAFDSASTHDLFGSRHAGSPHSLPVPSALAHLANAMPHGHLPPLSPPTHFAASTLWNEPQDQGPPFPCSPSKPDSTWSPASMMSQADWTSPSAGLSSLMRSSSGTSARHARECECEENSSTEHGKGFPSPLPSGLVLSSAFLPDPEPEPEPDKVDKMTSKVLPIPVPLRDPIAPGPALPAEKHPSTAPMLDQAVKAMRDVYRKMLSTSGVYSPWIQQPSSPSLGTGTKQRSLPEEEQGWTPFIPLLDCQPAPASPGPDGGAKTPPPLTDNVAPSPSPSASASSGGEVQERSKPRTSPKRSGRNRTRSSPLPVLVPTGDGKRPWECTTCGRAFERKSNLRQHLDVHMRRRPFECPLPWCNDKFSRRNDAARHVKKVHVQREEITEEDKERISLAHPKFVF